MNGATKLDTLRSLIANQQFHHATYRNIGTLWEGLWIYVKSPSGPRGFDMGPISFLKGDSEFDQAHEIVRHTGILVGSFGQG